MATKKRAPAMKAKPPETREEWIAHAKSNVVARSTEEDTPEPTFEFILGEPCRIGNLEDCIVEEVYANGKFVVVSHKTIRERGCTLPEGHRSFAVWEWFAVTPTRFVKETSFGKPRKHHSAINTDLRAFIHSALYFGIDDKPEFQRGYVWTDADRERLLDSVFAGRDIGKFVLVKRPFPHKTWVLDGKQRLKTLTDFFLGRFKYRGYTWHELSWRDRMAWRDLYVQYIEMNENTTTKRDMLELFLELNTAGVPVSEEHIATVRKMYDALKDMEDFC